MMHEAFLIPLGIVISSVAMAIGIGGGILWTPLLILVYKLSPAEAITTSILIQVVGLGSGSFAYKRSQLVKTKLAASLFLIALPGVIIGSLITINLPRDIVQMSLGIMTMVLAILFVASDQDHEIETSTTISKKKILRIAPIPGFFGFIMGFLSLGISEWLVPALRNKLNMDMPSAIATSITMMFMLALVSASVHFFMSTYIHYNIIVFGIIGALVGGQLGPRISQKINDRLLKQSFIYLMTLIGIHLIFQAI